ncbi:MAG: flagellar biosynthetic protein FliO [Lachnospiraceae bacterium]|nr:flagellar biosynthetic protein FliO [Lachnospiraceae bacterium]
MALYCLLSLSQPNAAYSSGGWEDAAHLFTVLVIFVCVLGLTYFTTRFVGKYEEKFRNTGNIEVLEISRIANGKFIGLVRIGTRYIAIGITKENLSMLAEISKDDLDLNKDGDKSFKDFIKNPMDFRYFLNRAKDAVSEKKRRKEDDKDEK